MKNKKFKKLWIALSMVVAILIIFIGGIVVYLSQNPPVTLLIENVDFTTVSDGIHRGDANNGIIQVEVAVTVTNGRVTDIEILEHRNGLGGSAEAITDIVINEQSLEVDGIASATYSSNTILKAIENALLGAE